MAKATKAQNLSARKPLTQERLKQLLHYDPETGEWTWLVDRFAGEHHSVRLVKKGDRAGTIKRNGQLIYRKLTIDGRSHRSARVAFLYMTGETPPRADHRDCNGLNDAWENLRPCTQAQNARNTRRRSDNTSGIKGVHWYKSRQKWQVQLRCDGKRINIGYFENKNDAARAYEKAAAELFGEFARTS